MASDSRIARPRLGSIVETYVRNRLPRGTHPAFKVIRDHSEASTAIAQNSINGGLSLDLRRQDQVLEDNLIDQGEGDELALEELYRDAESEKERFRLALESYEKTTAGSKFKTDLAIGSAHTWEEVLVEVNNASDNYESASGSWGKIRKAFRRFGKNNKAFTAWSTLLPSESEYFSILCGGVKLIIGAAARLHELREDICDALAEIPILLMSTQRTLAVFRNSKDLHRCSSALYVATIAALHHIVMWYKETAYKKITKSIFKQSSYGEKLTSLLEAVRKQSKLFEKSAELCLYETSVNTNQEVKSQRMESRTNQTILVGYLDQSQKKIGMLEEELFIMRQVLVKFLSSNARIDFKTQDVRGPMLPLRRASSESKLIRDRSEAQNAFLSAFGFESSVIRRDVESSLRGVWTLPRPDQDRIVAIMQSPKLHRWIAETSSSALFINANCKGFRKQQISFISAKLVDSIRPPSLKSEHRPSSVFALSFFCGEHQRLDDPDWGVDGMMRSLVGQLLLSYPNFKLNVIEKMHSMNYDSVEDLCRMFYMLISQLPPHIVVFCIIDSISFFEDNEVLCEESELVMQELTDIIEKAQHRGCTFKLLLTSQWNSRVLYKALPYQERDVVWMPAKVPSQGGFTGMKWSDSVGADVTSLIS
ncbi:hypothetical protein F5884DRAFT_769740 [Xylogone sp. PMI_703]|nr:hypothetical protein F5884DRAFT_769740 [Xylogone sp. PMI_703]